ncbi:hypothetical protein ABPG72_002929 [Tetrahymena utriculariae]
MNQDFLKDLDDLDDDEEIVVDDGYDDEDNNGEDEMNDEDLQNLEGKDDEDFDGDNLEEQIVKKVKTQNRENEKENAIQEFKTAFQKVQSKPVSNLLNDTEFKKLYQKIQEYKGKQNVSNLTAQDDEYHVIIRSNEYAAIIEREIQAVHKFAKDIFLKRLAELQDIVINPIDYAKCVKLIKNESDIMKLDFSSIPTLTMQQITSISVAASQEEGKYLNANEYKQVIAACDNILELHEMSLQIQAYIESRMKFIAPNLSALVGSTCASRLVTAAGGVEALQRMPACNIQVMGSQKKSLLGMSKEGQGNNRGYFAQLEMVQKAPPQFQTKLVRMLSTNVAKAVRIDFLKTCPSGSAGKRLYDLMIQRFSKVQEPPPAKMNKALAKPDDKPSRKRGGEKYRKIKERLGLTNLRALSQRMMFGDQAEEEFRDTGKGFGLLGVQAGTIKVNVSKKKIKLTQKQQKQQAKQEQRQVPLKIAGEDMQDGLASSLQFTSNQGIELINPYLLKQDGIKTENYFNKDVGFRTVVETKNNVGLLPGQFKAPN